MRSHRICLLAGSLAAGTMLCAQSQPQPLTRVGMVNVKPGHEAEWFNVFKKSHQPVMDKLLADGTVLAWGVDVPLHHRKGFASHTYWWAVPNYAALEKANRLRAEAMQKMSPADRETLLTKIDQATHEDALLRTITASFKPVPSGTLPYTRFIMTRVKPGYGSEYLRVWQQNVKPVYERLLADGAIFGYELMEQAENAMEAEWRWSLVSLPDLGAMDKVSAAFAALDQKRAADRLAPIAAVFSDATVPGSRRDWILRAIAYGSR